MLGVNARVGDFIHPTHPHAGIAERACRLKQRRHDSRTAGKQRRRADDRRHDFRADSDDDDFPVRIRQPRDARDRDSAGDQRQQASADRQGEDHQLPRQLVFVDREARLKTREGRGVDNGERGLLNAHLIAARDGMREIAAEDDEADQQQHDPRPCDRYRRAESIVGARWRCARQRRHIFSRCRRALLFCSAF